MPLQPTPPATLTPAALTAMAADMQTNIDVLTAVNINLTMPERMGAKSVSDKRLPFMVDYYGNKNDYPTLKPQFMNEAESDTHWGVAQTLANIEFKANKMLELVTDIRLNAEHFAFSYGLEGYAVVGRAKDQNVPGADTFYDLLKRHFEQTSGGLTGDGTRNPPPAPPLDNNANGGGTPPPPAPMP